MDADIVLHRLQEWMPWLDIEWEFGPRCNYHTNDPYGKPLSLFPDGKPNGISYDSATMLRFRTK
jgi:hypothetical protein